ncbi:MAG: nucleotidyltransferase [Candidatus Portnoybacteria bacterium CG23_combo_of_CG06-09_8_20_14_all_37_13]|uniref:Nucleotidyltransferase n=1 Tax=Candidatus Portnoybacteria bacterium CG23_combo_of_CG06-09_8_20_14_all_37_13 TaxID=1974819 RepID=A0A2G9YCK9_9BACT|nr:MAG: nucleotidyltransferase [Candidatus Portnoybacteria bacterium CG23_combo_of_CG06-09_8_20_14_all_37_13]
MSKLEAIKNQYKRAVDRFEEILNQEKTEMVRDSAIKRFEFCFDLCWKTIKAFLEEEKGITCRSPKECFRQAFQQELLDYDDFWLRMTDWRNQAIHTYSEKFADAFFKELPKTLKRFKMLLEILFQNN